MERIEDLLSQESCSYDEFMELRELGYTGNVTVRFSSVVHEDHDGCKTILDHEAFDNLFGDGNVTMLFFE